MLEVTTPPPRRSRATDATTRPLRWTKEGRTREAQLYRMVVRQLREHVGGKPSRAQELLIGRIAMLQTHLARMDERWFREGELSDNASRQYLAWANSISRMLQALGLASPPDPVPTLAEQLAAARAEREVKGEPTGRSTLAWDAPPPGPVQAAAVEDLA